MIALFEFRKQAVYNRSYFSKDPQRKLFLVDQFRRNLLHITVLKVNNTIIAAEVHTVEGKKLYSIGINTHAPQYAKFSPGTLHKLLLTKVLAEEGIEEFDLTPGGEPYKDELATHYDTAYTLSVSSFSKKLTITARAGIGGFLKRCMAKVASLWGISYEQLRLFRERRLLYFIDRLRALKKQKPAAIIKQVAGLLQAWITNKLSGKKTTRYCLSVENNLPAGPLMEPIKTNSLSDLLAFNDTDVYRWQFFKDAQQRLEAGQTVYTWTCNGCLMAAAWLKSTPTVPTATLQLEGFYFHRASQPQLPAFLKAVISFATRQAPGSVIQVHLGARERALQQAFVQLGFHVMQ
jgi:hypothetical protein